MYLRLAWLLPAVSAVCVLAAWLVLPYQQVDILHEEGEFVENATVVFYLAAALLLFAQVRSVRDWRSPAALGILMLLFAARELDFHKRWTDNYSTLRLDLFTKQAFGMPQFLTVVAVLLCVTCLGWLWLRHGRGLWGRLRQREPIALGMVLFFGTMAIAKFFDRSHSFMADVGYNPPPALLTLLRSWEETFEMTLPLIVICMTLHVLALRRGAYNPDGRAVSSVG